MLSGTSWRGALEIANPENKMLAHLPIVILASLLPMPVADAMPKLDIARECQFEGGIKPTQERRSEEHTSELQSRRDLVCRLLLEQKKPPRTFLTVCSTKFHGCRDGR